MGARRVVLGVGIAAYPEGGAGNTWIFLNWALSLQKLGWEVWLVEELPRGRLEGKDGPVALEASRHAAYWEGILRRFGLRGSLVVEGEGWPEDGFGGFVVGADWFVNLSGHFKRLDLVRGIPRRMYVDLDPGFTQVWAEGYGAAMNLEGHTDFVTIALGWNDREARVPRDGREWLAVAPPVDLDWWAYSPNAGGGAWTTVTHWYGYPRVEWDGLVLENKSTEFAGVRELPRRGGWRLQIASDLEPGWEDYRVMAGGGWELVAVREVCRDCDSYGRFVRGSVGEFSVAKGGYVVMNSGWFSDRTVCYLASGRPAVVQETGWSRHVPEGAGLAPFRSEEEAAAVLARLSADPEGAGRAARETAERYFDGRRVLGSLLDRLG